MRISLCLILVAFYGCAGGKIDARGPEGGSIAGAEPPSNSPSDGMCSPGERRCSSDTKTQTCRDDGTWATPRSCVRAVCSEGVCKRDEVSCADTCTPGDQQCSPPMGIQDCRVGDDGCGQWAAPTQCPDGLVCDPRQSKCVQDSCQSVCTIDARQCSGENIMTCIRQGECTEWSAPTPCPNGQTCSADQCSGACTDACAEGETRCSGTELQICARLPNGCLGFGMPAPCSAGQVCDPSANACVSQCGQMECQANETRCFNRSVQQCGQDLNGCAIWTRIDPCPDGQECPANGTQCEQVCQPQCTLNERRCGDAGYQVCELDANGCEAWSQDMPCEAGTLCQGAGACIESCADGYTETRQCGECGSQERLCMGRQWTAWTACSGMGQPAGERACNDCGTQRRECLPSGDWSPWEDCRGSAASNLMCDPNGYGACTAEGVCVYYI